MRNTLLTGLCIGLLSLAGWADPRSGPNRQTMMEQPWGTLFCTDKCSFSADRGGQRFQITSPEGPVSVSVQAPWLQIQTPGGNIMRIRSQESAAVTEILVQLDKVNYRIFKRYGETEWKFPDDRVYFKTQDGNLRDALGSKGNITVRRNFQKNTFVVESPEATSEFELETDKPSKKSLSKKPTYKLKLVEGDPPTKYPYLYRGLVFELGSVGFYLPLTSGKFTNALEWNQVQSFKASVTAYQSPNKKDPANAEIPNNAVQANEDPLNLKLKPKRREFKAVDPLKASSNPQGAEILKVKTIDTNAPQPAP